MWDIYHRNPAQIVEYNKQLNSIKETGCKVLRNSAGKHKIITTNQVLDGEYMLKKCADCKHCKVEMKHYENVPEMFSTFLEFYCTKNGENRYLGHMVKKKDEVEYLDCFEERNK